MLTTACPRLNTANVYTGVQNQLKHYRCRQRIPVLAHGKPRQTRNHICAQSETKQSFEYVIHIL